MVSEAFAHLFHQELEQAPAGERSPKMVKLAHAWDCFRQVHEACLNKALDDLKKNDAANTIIKFLNAQGGTVTAQRYMTPAQNILQKLQKLAQDFLEEYKNPAEDNVDILLLKLQYETQFQNILSEVKSEFSSCSVECQEDIVEIYETLHLNMDNLVWNLNDFIKIDNSEGCLRRASQEQYDADIATIDALKIIHPEQTKALNTFISGLHDLRKDYLESSEIDDEKLSELTGRFNALQKQAKEDFQEIPAIWASLWPCLQCLFKILVIPYVVIQMTGMMYSAARSALFQPIDDKIKKTWDALQLDAMPKVYGPKKDK